MSDSVMLHGFGGGAGLNFDVKVYATEEALSADKPRENTIGIVTEIPAPAYVFAPVEPSMLQEGLIWIRIGAASTVAFNALKRNAIQIYPISANQCHDGAFSFIAAKSYQNGEWHDWWDGTIYNNGMYYAIPHESAITGDGAVIEEKSDHIAFTVKGGVISEVYEVFGPVSLTEYTTLNVTANTVTSGCVTWVAAFIADSKTANRLNNLGISEVIVGNADTAVELDVSAFGDGPYYIFVGVNSIGSMYDIGRTCRVTEITVKR